MKNWKLNIWQIIAVILLVIMVAMVAVCFHHSEVKKKNEISVDAMYIFKNGETNKSVNASAIIYLTNIGKKSGDVKIVVYLINATTNIAIDKKEKELGRIPIDKTKEIEMPICMRNASYRIDVLVFENDMLVIKGSTMTNVYYDEGWIIRMKSSPEFYSVHDK